MIRAPQDQDAADVEEGLELGLIAPDAGVRPDRDAALRCRMAGHLAMCAHRSSMMQGEWQVYD